MIEPIVKKSPVEIKAIYKKINNTRYIVEVYPNEDNFWLVLNEGFHTDWKVYVYKVKSQNPGSKSQVCSALWNMWIDRGNRVELKDHYKVNGYANGWYIDKSQAQESMSQGGKIEILLEYIPQRWLEVGFLISFVVIVSSMIYLFLNRS